MWDIQSCVGMELVRQLQPRILRNPCLAGREVAQIFLPSVRPCRDRCWLVRRRRIAGTALRGYRAVSYWFASRENNYRLPSHRDQLYTLPPREVIKILYGREHWFRGGFCHYWRYPPCRWEGGLGSFFLYFPGRNGDVFHPPCPRLLSRRVWFLFLEKVLQGEQPREVPVWLHRRLGLWVQLHCTGSNIVTSFNRYFLETFQRDWVRIVDIL